MLFCWRSGQALIYFILFSSTATESAAQNIQKQVRSDSRANDSCELDPFKCTNMQCDQCSPVTWKKNSMSRLLSESKTTAFPQCMTLTSQFFYSESKHTTQSMWSESWTYCATLELVLISESKLDWFFNEQLIWDIFFQWIKHTAYDLCLVVHKAWKA